VQRQRLGADGLADRAHFEVVQPTDAQRPALDELRAANAKAIDILKAGCPKDLPSTPTGRLTAMESRLQVMLQAVQTVRPALDRFYQSLDDEQKARFNAVSPGGDSAASDDRRGPRQVLRRAHTRGDRSAIDRIAQAVQPTQAQRTALDELKDASTKAAEALKANCPSYQALTPTGRVEAMEKRSSHPRCGPHRAAALAKFYDGAQRRTEGALQFAAFGVPSGGIGSADCPRVSGPIAASGSKTAGGGGRPS
jgi:hypothetical protein